MKEDKKNLPDNQAVEELVGRLAARPRTAADIETLNQAEAAYKEAREAARAGKKPAAGELLVRLMNNRRMQAAVAAMALLLIVVGVCVVFSEGAKRLTVDAGKSRQADIDIDFVRKLYEMGNIKGLKGVLASSPMEARIAAANYLALVGDQNAIAPLKKAGKEWQGDAAANPFTKAADAIAARAENAPAAASTASPAPSRTAAISDSAPIAPAPSATSVSTDLAPAEPNMLVMLVTVLDKATGKPLKGAKVRLSYDLMGKSLEPVLETNDKGTAVVRIPAVATYLHVRPRISGYVPMFRHWQGRDLKLPKVCIFSLDKAITIGGIVNDPNGSPLEGVTVSVFASRREGKDPAEEPVISVTERIATGKDGRWSCNVVPPELPDLLLNFEHPQYRRGVSQPDDAEKKSLIEGSFTTVMEAGKRLHGVVRSQDGTPIKGATAFVGSGWSASQKARTDENGRFEFAAIEEQDEMVAVRAKRYAPEMKPVPADLSAEMEFVLGPGHIFKGRVTNTKGEPLPGAVVVLQRWRGHRLFSLREICDPNGRFVMNSLPGDELEITLFCQGYMEKELKGVIADGKDHEYVLGDMLRVTGKVVDAETGRPVKKFMVIPGLGMSDDQREEIVWQDGSDWRKSGKDGQYEYQFQYAGTKYGIRIEADGYVPAESEPIDANAAHAVRDFRLKTSAGVNGVVTLPDGSPVAGAVVLTLDRRRGVTIRNGSLMNEGEYKTVKTDSGGRFHLPDPGTEYYVIALGTAGLGLVTDDVFRQKGTLALEPWARVEGKCMIGTRPAVNWQVYGYYPQDERKLPLSVSNDSVKTDEQGGFVLDKLVPGPMRISCTSGEKGLMAEVEVVAGQTVHVNLGGGGWKVTADLVIPADLQERLHELTFTHTIDGALDFKGWVERTPWPAEADTMSAAALNVWLDDFVQSPAGKQLDNELYAARRKGRYHEIEINGSKAVIEDVLSGDYYMIIRLCEKKSDGKPDYNATRAMAFVEFTVPQGSPPDYEMPFDLGKIELTKPLAKGMVAPDLEIDSIADGRIRLSDYKGKVVLLLVLNIYKNPADSDVQDLQRISRRIADFDEAAMIAVCSASRVNPLARAYLRDLQLACHKGFFEDEYMRLYSKYPPNNTKSDFSTVLIGRDGQVLALGLKGEELISRIEEALVK